jgi:hypothetical protein
MKRSAVLALCFLLSVSCTPKAPPPPLSSAPPSALPVVADSKNGFCLVNGLSVWDLGGAQPRQASTLQIGERVALTGKRTNATLFNKDRTVIEIRRDSGTQGWVREEFIASDSVLGVVTAEEAVLYTQPRNTGATGRTLSTMTIFAIRRDSAAQTFVRIAVYDTDALAVKRDLFLRNEGISSRVAEVETAVLCRLAADATNRTQREAYLKSALADYPASLFADRVHSLLEGSGGSGGTGGTAPEAANASDTELTGGAMAATQDNVHVLSAPDDTTGTVVASLVRGQTVQVEERTKGRTRIGSLSAPWYRIADPPGWVFGAFLATPP